MPITANGKRHLMPYESYSALLYLFWIMSHDSTVAWINNLGLFQFHYQRHQSPERARVQEHRHPGHKPQLDHSRATAISCGLFNDAEFDIVVAALPTARACRCAWPPA